MKNVAVVTGAGHGVGKKVAERLASRDFHVIVTDIDGDAARATAAAIGGEAVTQDVRDPDSHREVAKLAAERGRVAMWVNNAGILLVGTAWEMTDAMARRTVEINLLGVIWGCTAAIGVMGDGGHILNMGSMSSLSPAPGLAAYCASKHGVLGYSLSLAGELRRAGKRISVSVLCPDALAGEMTDRVAHDRDAAGILFSAGNMLTTDDAANAAIELLERPRLVKILPAYRAALIHLLRPFPAIGLPLLEGLAKLGRRRLSRTHEPDGARRADRQQR
jgi:short-subunit dehydrogenase